MPRRPAHKRPSGLWLTALLTSACAPGAWAAALRVPLEITKGEGCVFDAQHARPAGPVPAPDAQGFITIEAERPLRHFWNPSSRQRAAPPPSDPKASRGQYADALVYAQYAFLSPDAKRMALWARVATPKGRSRFRQLVNGRYIGPFFQEENKSAGKPYHWVRRGEARVEKGWNRLEVREFHGPFPKIDKFVFAPLDASIEGIGPAPRTQPCDRCWVETADVSVPGLERMVALEGAAQTEAVSVSVDGGKNWQPAHNRDVAGVNVPPGAPVRFRFTLQPGASRIGPLRLCADVDSARCIQMVHGDTRLVFDRDTGGLFLAANAATGDAVVAPGRPRPLVAIDFKRSGEHVWTRVGPDAVVRRVAKPSKSKGRWDEKAEPAQSHSVEPESVRLEGSRLDISYVFEQPGLGRARITCVVEPADEGLWRFAATAQSLSGPADVVAVVFPVFEHVRIGASGLDDHQLRLQSFGHHRVHPGMGPIRDTRYLGGCVMAWTEVYDERTGLYVGCHDPSAANVLFRSTAGGPTAEFFDMSTEKRHQIKPGQSRTWEYRVAAHSGGWHWGADRYRSWFHRTFGKAQYPAWMRECDGWIDLQAENYGAKFRFDQLPDWLTRARAVGLDWVQVWGQFAYDGGPCCCAFYGPSPQYGGANEWRRAALKIAARGGHMGGYFIYDRVDLLPLVTDSFLGHFSRSDYAPTALWPAAELVQRLRLVPDPSNQVPSWPPPAKEIADYNKLIKEHKRLYTEGKRAKPVQWWQGVYINDPEWRRFMAKWIVDKYVREYGCNTVYIDVLGCGGARESFDPRREHNGDGTWGMGKLQLAKHIVESARQLLPDFGPTMEGLGDLPGLYFAPMCSGVYRGGRNVYRYTFPERVLLHGMANSGSGGSAIKRFLETFVEGMRFDVVGRPTALPVYMLALQRQFTPWLYQATFRDTLGLRLSDPRVQARRFVLNGQAPHAALVTLANPQRLQDVQVTLDEEVTGPANAAFAVSVGGKAEALAVQRGQGQSIFTVPDALASTVLVVGEGRRGPSVWPVVHLRRQSPAAVRVTLLNLTPSVQRGSCALSNMGFTEPFQERSQEAQAALPLSSKEQSVELGPWQAKACDFAVSSLREHWWTVRVEVQLTLEDAEPVSRTFLLTPLVLDGSWEFLGTREEFVAHGQHTLTLPPTESGYQHRVVDFWLEPGRRYRYHVQARRSGFTARVAGTLLMVNGETDRFVWKRYGLDRERPDEWQTLTDTFETPPDLTRAGIYLYNVVSPDTAWFDDLWIEDLGP